MTILTSKKNYHFAIFVFFFSLFVFLFRNFSYFHSFSFRRIASHRIFFYRHLDVCFKLVIILIIITLFITKSYFAISIRFVDDKNLNSSLKLSSNDVNVSLSLDLNLKILFQKFRKSLSQSTINATRFAAEKEKKRKDVSKKTKRRRKRKKRERAKKHKRNKKRQRKRNRSKKNSSKSRFSRDTKIHWRRRRQQHDNYSRRCSNLI